MTRDPLTSWEAEVGSVRVVSGPGRLTELPALVAELGVAKLLLVTDPGLEAAGHADRALAALAGTVETVVFDGVEENPTSHEVERGTRMAHEAGIEAIVALGGGSAMDCAKGINFLYTNGGKMEDYWGIGRAKRPMLPSLAVPSTAGTGSEAQSYALITHPENGRKMACGDPKARFRAVILDPEVASTAPRRVAAATGMDAVSHAVETAVSRRSNPVSRMLSRTAWRLISNRFQPALTDPSDLGAIAAMQLGAHLAGAAIEASMLGAAHAAANPLTARHHIVHGEAVGLMLPHVVRFNGAGPAPAYDDLEPAGSDRLANRVEEFRRAAGLAEQLRDRGVGQDSIPELAEMATLEWTGEFNPRPVTAADFEKLYEAAY